MKIKGTDSLIEMYISNSPGDIIVHFESKWTAAASHTHFWQVLIKCMYKFIAKKMIYKLWSHELCQLIGPHSSGLGLIVSLLDRSCRSSPIHFRTWSQMPAGQLMEHRSCVMPFPHLGWLPCVRYPAAAPDTGQSELFGKWRIVWPCWSSGNCSSRIPVFVWQKRSWN